MVNKKNIDRSGSQKFLLKLLADRWLQWLGTALEILKRINALE